MLREANVVLIILSAKRLPSLCSHREAGERKTEGERDSGGEAVNRLSIQGEVGGEKRRRGRRKREAARESERENVRRYNEREREREKGGGGGEKL